MVVAVDISRGKSWSLPPVPSPSVRYKNALVAAPAAGQERREEERRGDSQQPVSSDRVVVREHITIPTKVGKY